MAATAALMTGWASDWLDEIRTWNRWLHALAKLLRPVVQRRWKVVANPRLRRTRFAKFTLDPPLSRLLQHLSLSLFCWFSCSILLDWWPLLLKHLLSFLLLFRCLLPCPWYSILGTGRPAVVGNWWTLQIANSPSLVKLFKHLQFLSSFQVLFVLVFNPFDVGFEFSLLLGRLL